MPKRKTKLRVFVKGGCVQGLFSTNGKEEAELVDFDNQEDESLEADNRAKEEECETNPEKWREIELG